MCVTSIALPQMLLDIRYRFYDLTALGERYVELPFSIRVLLESAVRNCDNFQILQSDVEKILSWKESQAAGLSVEVPYNHYKNHAWFYTSSQIIHKTRHFVAFVMI